MLGSAASPSRLRARWVAPPRCINGGVLTAGPPVLETLGRIHRYHRCVFLTPPWPEIYVTDPERRHGFNDAVAEYLRLLEAYASLGYEVFILPKVGVTDRADLMMKTLER
jgi:predicted ATPase